ncbi:class I SAM-dependent methyltransferase [Solirubrobacter deserti]|uniref:Class I SAM-dependent methyltransferase n=1 Tax=Solirubrobacter deserti TaxID=2282478 RepID=A0ABT4RVB1_9ACTN|nr:class I SAM-dependent methyltransferase [Solirubrobacter deserti]MDA0142195.1 class I SAM-dependent methyltransferase [Solirubrobacter deserti]
MPETIYDEVRYSNFPYAQTHPDRLATVAVLHGIQPPDPFTARVLEIGCGAGGNLLAMAAASPNLRAVGVDLAAKPIAEAQQAVSEIGLTNLEFRQEDVRGLTNGALGQFDYVVAHGVYGWMPEDADDALLAAIKASLAPAGIAYVSFNAQPGGYFRRMLRDVGLWHARHESSVTDKAEKAQELFKFLQEYRVSDADTYGQLLGREVGVLADAPSYKLVHDDLGESWTPRWFAEFAEHAGRHGLGYVGEADLFSLRSEMLPEGVEALVWELADGDRIAFENISDALTARHFRQSVVAHAGNHATAEAAPERTMGLHWAVRPNAEPLEIGLTADAFAVLDRERPRALPFEALRAELDAEPEALAEALLDGFRRERLMPHAGPLRAAIEPGERPSASRLARWQASRGADMVSLAYMRVRMEEPAARVLITLLDGTRDRAAIRADLAAAVGFELSEEDLERNLVELARLFLLEP